MRHPTEGVLRRLLDEPAGVADADREHVATCAACRGELATARTDADLVHAALAVDDGVAADRTATGRALDADLDADVDLDAAWRRLSASLSDTGSAAAPAPRPVRVVSPRRSGRLRTVARRPVVAGVAVALVVAGAGAAAAGDWLEIFRTEEITPVSFSAADLNALPELSRYGTVAVDAEPDVHPVADAAAAEAETGLDVPDVVALPRGVEGEPDYQVGSEASATFTFSAERAAEAAADAGEEAPPVPPGLDGSQVRLVAGPGVAELWSARSGVPALLVARAVAPSAFSSGVPFEAVRDHLLSLPGIPDDVAATLRTFNADGSTLPLPVPGELVTTADAEVNGVPATVLATRDGSLAAVVWVDDGVVTVVAGSLSTDEVLAVARELR